MTQVFIEMEKLKNLNSGLGQFNLHLGKALVKQNTEFDLNFYVPASCNGIFGPQRYTIHSPIHRLFSAVPKGTALWHGTHQQTKYLPSDKQVKKILTVHDLNFLYKYEGSKRKLALNKLQRLIDKVDKVVTISAFTAGDLKSHINLEGKNPVVIYNGNTLHVHENVQRPAWVKNTPFLFALGVLTARKNFHTLVAMMVHLPQLQLVIAGSESGDYIETIRKEINKHKLEDRITLIGNINDEEKYWLYKNMQAFVFPSLAEGFGLPVIEAMSLGKPVFISNRSSLPEIGGNLAYYWNDFDAERMADMVTSGLKECQGNTSKQQEFIAHAARFTWENCATGYLRLYHETLGA